MSRLMPSVTTMPNDRVEVFSGVQRRRRYTLEQKLAAVAEASQPGMSMSFVARKYGIYMDASCFAKSLSEGRDRSGCSFISGLFCRLKPPLALMDSADPRLIFSKSSKP
jgi:hypothetical protein